MSPLFPSPVSEFCLPPRGTITTGLMCIFLVSGLHLSQSFARRPQLEGVFWGRIGTQCLLL